MIYSIAKLSPTSRPRLKFTLNATTLFGLQRTFHAIALLLLSTKSNLVLNAETLIHLWYSARLPQNLDTHAGNRMANIRKIAQIKRQDPTGQTNMFEWEQQNLKVRFNISVDQMKLLDETFNSFPRLTPLERVQDCERHERCFSEHAARMTRSRAMGLLRWRRDGLLLPYDHPRQKFSILNP